MPLTLEEYRRRFPDRPDPIPPEYAGKWIAMTGKSFEVVINQLDRKSVPNQIRESERNDRILNYHSPHQR